MQGITRIVEMLLIVVVCAPAARSSEVAASPLELVGTADGREFRDFVIERGKMLVRDGTKTSPLPVGIQWRLDGDLRAHADQILLRPDNEILTRPVRGASRTVQARTFGVMRIGRAGAWKQLRGAVIVFAWIVDGEVKWVEARAVSPNAGPSADVAAITVLELDGEMARGFPVALAFNDGQILSSESPIRQEPLRQVVSDIYFGSSEALERDLSAIRSVNRYPVDANLVYRAHQKNPNARAHNREACDREFIRKAGRPVESWIFQYISPVIPADGRPRLPG